PPARLPYIDLYHSHLSTLPTRHPPDPPLFPYTTLFRSFSVFSALHARRILPPEWLAGCEAQGMGREQRLCPRGRSRRSHVCHKRSEEHTSELQSRENLVCRLLLEKKKKENERQYHNNMT